MFTEEKNNGIMNMSDDKNLSKRISELEDELEETVEKVKELEERIEYLEETPDEYDKWHDNQL